MIKLSKRINTLSESATLAMSRKSRELKAQGHDVINLSIGEPDFDTPTYIKDSAKKALDDNYTHYTPVAGFQDLREAVSKKFKRDNNLDYSPDQIVVSTGAKQAIANVMMSLVDPGDEVLVPTPYWVSYTELVKLAEGKSVFIPARIEADFKVTPEQVEQAITKKTKLFIFSSPCNPTGSVYSKEELRAIADVFAKHKDIYIIADEIYEQINFGAEHYSMAQFEDIKDRVITINGVSKGYAMTGWRLGFLAANKEIAKACDKYQGQITSGTCAISQRATIDAISIDPKTNEDLKVMLKAFRERRDLVLDMLNEIPGMKTNIPTGAFYVFPNISGYFGKSDGTTTIKDSNDFCLYLLNKAHVATVPGEAFGDPDCFRISYATSNEILIESINRIKKALAELK